MLPEDGRLRLRFQISFQDSIYRSRELSVFVCGLPTDLQRHSIVYAIERFLPIDVQGITIHALGIKQCVDAETDHVSLTKHKLPYWDCLLRDFLRPHIQSEDISSLCRATQFIIVAGHINTDVMIP